MGNTVATPNKEADTEEEPYKHPKIVLTESQQERHDTMRDFYLSFVRHSPYDDSDRKLAVKLLRNVIKGGRVPSVLKSARATTGGKEEAASWDSPAHNFSALHMGATLGRAEEMDAILRTWAQRRTIVALPEWQAVSWLVDAVGKRHQLTALMEAAKGDQPAAVECLAGKWRANPLVFLEFSGGEGWGTALHICARLSRVACGEAILSACVSDEHRAQVVAYGGPERHSLDTAFDVALGSGHLEFAKMLTNPKWGRDVVEALDIRSPIARHRRIGDPAVFNFLCEVFTQGLQDAFVDGRDEYKEVIMNHPAFPQAVNLRTSGDLHTTCLLEAVWRKKEVLAMRLLSLGADPNVAGNLPSTLKDGLDLPKRALTPIVVAVVTEQKNLVEEMARRDGVLPPEFFQVWARGDPMFSIKTFLDGTWEKHVKAKEDYDEALPPKDEHWELQGSMSFAKDRLSTTDIPIDSTITSLMVRYNVEINGVLEYLDVRTLGRIQQTSKFWYHVGRSNSLWKSVLLNTSREWKEKVKFRFHVTAQILEQDETTKWKHVGFFWLSNNWCERCHQFYQNCEGLKCVVWPDKHHHHAKRPYHQPRADHPQLSKVVSVFNSIP